MTKHERLVAFWIHTEWHSSEYDGNSWQTFKQLASDVGIQIRSAKRAVRSLAKKGLMYRDFTVDYEGNINGSGYFFTRKWDESGYPEIAQSEREAENPDDLDECWWWN